MVKLVSLFSHLFRLEARFTLKPSNGGVCIQIKMSPTPKFTSCLKTKTNKHIMI